MNYIGCGLCVVFNVFTGDNVYVVVAQKAKKETEQNNETIETRAHQEMRHPNAT